MTRHIYILVCSLVTAGQVVSAQSGSVVPSKDEIQGLLTRAYNQSNLWSDGSPAFHLRAKTKAYGLKGAAIEGTYEIWWASKNRWRTDVTWSRNTSSQIAAENQIWITGEDTHRADTSRVEAVLKTWQGLYLDVAKSKIQTKDAGSGESPKICVSGQKPNLPSQTICFDPTTGSLSETHLADQRWEYSDYVNVSSKRYPRRIRYVDYKEPVVDVDVEVLEPVNVAQTTAFAPPVDTVPSAWCADMVKPALSRFDPSMPIPRNYIDLGMVVFTVDEKGRTMDVQAYQAAGPHPLDKNERRTLMQNVFKPATCHGVALPGEFVIWH